MCKIWAVLAALAFSAAAAAAPNSILNPSWGVLFPAAAAPQLAHQCSRPGPSPVSGVWQPVQAQIDAMEPRLAAYLAQQLAPYSKDKFAGANYYRQYGGLLVNGRGIIYVNGFHRQVLMGGSYSDWKSRAVLLCDGGIQAFGVEYDPITGVFSKFTFNGHL